MKHISDYQRQILLDISTHAAQEGMKTMRARCDVLDDDHLAVGAMVNACLIATAVSLAIVIKALPKHEQLKLLDMQLDELKKEIRRKL